MTAIARALGAVVAAIVLIAAGSSQATVVYSQVYDMSDVCSFIHFCSNMDLRSTAIPDGDYYLFVKNNDLLPGFPLFQVDYTFTTPAGDGYEYLNAFFKIVPDYFSFTIDVSNDPADRFVTYVPEPATWGLMLLGMGGMGACLRRRRRASAVGQVHPRSLHFRASHTAEADA